MFLIDGNYFELVLEDGDIAVLSNIVTGEYLTMDIKELWNYAIWKEVFSMLRINKKSVATTTSSTDNQPNFDYILQQIIKKCK